MAQKVARGGGGAEGVTPGQWARLKSLFHDALSQPEQHRSAWLSTAAGGDADLLRELRELIDAHTTAGDFLEQPAVVDAANDVVEPSDDVLTAGARLGHYE